MSKKKKVFFSILTWIGTATLPYLIRKWTEETGKFTGRISTLNYSNDKSIGYYLIPGLIPLPRKLAQSIFEPKKYDFNLIEYGHKDYNLEAISFAIDNHIKQAGYQKVRLITIGLGDHLLAFLDYTLADMIRDEKVEVVTIDNLPSPDFLSRHSYKLLSLVEPGLMSLRIFFGWLAEIPFIRFRGDWRSPAVLIEQLSSLVGYIGDYSQDEIMSCIKAVVKNGEASYASPDIDSLLDITFNFVEDEQEDAPPCKTFYNYFGNPSNLADSITAGGCLRVLKNLDWNF
ncbi:hypothetical protein IKG73_02735 [Candidatus Saccharibacteria bacterium]|nr:hypothetical protein [Candidatus Saccharibacteria bacterium]